MSSRTYVFLSIIININISDIVTAFWRYRKKSRSKPGLLEQLFFLSLEFKQHRCSYHTDDDQLTFTGYNLIRADNSNNIKRGGVCIYHRDSLPVKVINSNVLNECLVCELSFGSQRVCLVSIYRTPSQSSNECNTFLLNFEQLLTYLNSIKPHVQLVTGDFNVRSSSWWSEDIDTV